MESVLVQRLAIRAGILRVVAWQLLIGSVPLSLASVLAERDARIGWSVAVAGLLLYLALVGTAFATALWYRLVQDDEVSRLSSLLFLVPVLGLGIAVIVFSEQIDPIEAGGVALVVAGIVILAREAWRDASRPVPSVARDPSVRSTRTPRTGSASARERVLTPPSGDSQASALPCR